MIRGQVISREGNGLIGIRVSVATDPQFGFTLTRGDGWYVFEFVITSILKMIVMFLPLYSLASILLVSFLTLLNVGLTYWSMVEALLLFNSKEIHFIPLNVL